MNQLPNLEPENRSYFQATPATKPATTQPTATTQATTQATKARRQLDFSSLVEPNWSTFTTGVYSTMITGACILKTSPVHGWLAANLKPVPWLGVAILLFMIERAINHFRGGKLIRCLLRPPAILAASIALVTLLFYIG